MNIHELLEKIAAAEVPAEIEFEKNSKTTIYPARYVPTVDANERVYLDGKWDVKRFPFESEITSVIPDETIYQPGVLFRADPEIDPKNIESWNRTNMKHIHPEDGAVLIKEVPIPAEWDGKKIFLRFNAVYPAAHFYLNGELIGEHFCGLIPVEFDVTDRIIPGEKAAVTIRLFRYHPLINLDMPRHSMDYAGIAQSAYFHAVQPVYIKERNIAASLNYLNHGLIHGEVRIHNSTEQSAETSLDLVLLDAQHNEQAHINLQKVTIKPHETSVVKVNVNLQNPVPWSDENPYLYTLSLRLNSLRQHVQDLSQKIGFRTFSVSQKAPKWNNKFIKFRGINYLGFHPKHGLYQPRSWLKQNLLLMKRANINAIRTHYTASEDLCELCDELGFYLIQEVTIDWAAHHLDKRDHMGVILRRLEGVLRRDREHPSLAAVSIGNENLAPTQESRAVFWSNMNLLYAVAKKLAPHVMTMFPPPGPANKIKFLMETRVGDIADVHYSFVPVKSLHENGSMVQAESWEGPHTTVTSEQALQQSSGWHGVWFSSEWGLMNYPPDLIHSPYNSIIADTPEMLLSNKNSQQVFWERFNREWSYMRDSEDCLGGAFFPWMCAGVGAPWGWTYWGEDADWGVVMHDLTPKSNFWVIRQLYAPILLPQKTIFKKEDNSINITVKNLHHQRDLSECTIRILMGTGGHFMGILRYWEDITFACAGGETQTVSIPVKNESSQKALSENLPVVCRIVVLAPDKTRIIMHDLLVIPETAADSINRPVSIGPDANLADL